MQNEKAKEKKGLFILLIIIAAYIVVIVGIAIYVKLDKEGYFGSEPEDLVLVQTTKPKAQTKKTKQIEKVDDVQIHKEPEPLNTSNQVVEEAVPKVSVADKPVVDRVLDTEIIEPTEEEIEEKFDDDYAQYVGSTIADVPAGPRPQVEESVGDDVLSASDLTLNVEKQKGFWESFVDSIIAFFESIFGSDTEDGTAKTSMMTPEKIQALEEVEGELKEMQSKFTAYQEESGLIWFDHISKPKSLESFGFYVYIGLAPNNYAYHRTIIRYNGDDWIVLKSILIESGSRALVIDAEGLRQTARTTSASEWVDLAPTQENNDLLNIVASSDNIKLTFMGERKNVEWKLTNDELIGLRESLHFYNLLKEKEELLK